MNIPIKINNLIDLNEFISPRKKRFTPFYFQNEKGENIVFFIIKDKNYFLTIKKVNNNKISYEQNQKEFSTVEKLKDFISNYLKKVGFKDSRKKTLNVIKIEKLLEGEDKKKKLTLEELEGIINSEEFKNEFSTKEKNKIIKKHIRLKNKIKNEEIEKNIKVGDIFVHSFGYDTTLVEAFQIIEKKGKKVKLKEIKMAYVGEEDKKIPIPNDFIDKNKEPMVKILKGNSISINSYSWAYLWDGKRSYYTSRYY